MAGFRPWLLNAFGRPLPISVTGCHRNLFANISLRKRVTAACPNGNGIVSLVNSHYLISRQRHIINAHIAHRSLPDTPGIGVAMSLTSQGGNRGG